MTIVGNARFNSVPTLVTFDNVQMGGNLDNDGNFFANNGTVIDGNILTTDGISNKSWSGNFTVRGNIVADNNTPFTLGVAGSTITIYGTAGFASLTTFLGTIKLYQTIDFGGGLDEDSDAIFMIMSPSVQMLNLTSPGAAKVQYDGPSGPPVGTAGRGRLSLSL